MEVEPIIAGNLRIKVEERVEQRKVTIAHCPFCAKEIKGTVRSQCEWNLAVHINQIHGDDGDQALAKNKKPVVEATPVQELPPLEEEEVYVG